MKKCVNRWVSLALLMALVLSLLPAAALGADAVYGYVTVDKQLANRWVNFRAAPNTNDETNPPIVHLPEYWVVELMDKQPIIRNGDRWYHIRANVNVDGGPAQQQEGYVMASFITVMTAAEQAAWLANPTSTFTPSNQTAPAAAATATAVPAGEAVGFVRTIVGDVNLRETPGGKSLNENNLIPIGTVMAYYAFVSNVSGYSWVQVKYDGKTGYIRSDCFAYSDAYGNLISAATATPAAADPNATYGKVTMDDVLFRKAASTTADYWEKLPAGWIMQVLGTEKNNGITWYKVQGGTPSNPSRLFIGYIHSGYFTLTSGSATAAPSSTESNYALITLDGINLRSTPGGTATTALRANTVVNIITRPAGNTASDWYYVEYYGQKGYIPATAMRVLLNSELSNYTLPTGGSAAPATATPVPAVSGSGYVKLTLDQVNIRKTPGGTTLTPTDASKLKIGTVLAYTAGPVTSPMNGKDYQWVQVTYNGVTGYVRSDCYVYCYADGTPVNSPVTAAPTAVPTNNGTVASQGYIKLIRGDVNVRVSPWGTSLGRLARGTVLPYYNIKLNNNGNEVWYEVYSSQLGAFGYVLGTMAQVCDANGGDINGNTPSTPQPANVIVGYVATTASSVWLRAQPSTTAATVGMVQNKGTVLAMVGSPQNFGTNYLWYPVKTDTLSTAYIRGDFVYQLADWQIEQYNKTGVVPTPSPAPATPVPGTSDYIMITADNVWVRETASKQAGTLGQVSTGTILRFYQSTTVGTGANAVTWYQVAYNGKYGWIHGGFARVMSNSETGSITPAPATATPTANYGQLSDLALTTAGQVNIRATGSMNAKALTQVPKSGAQLTYLGQYTAPTTGNPYTWYNVRYNGVTGWIRGDFVRVLTVTEKAQYEATGYIDYNGGQSATYRTLSKGSTGDDVRALQQRLYQLGYLAASEVTGTYLTSTENAVIAFQKAKGMTADGIAGSATQHALFGTVEPSNGSSVTVTLYPVEKIDWYTGGIQNIWKVNTVAIITDVYTGISFKAQRLYGDNHADCEPLTAADTAAYCRIYGVSDPQDISDREQELRSYRRRPLWVTIGGRTFCASMYGIPHNYDGDRIADNGFNGQFCVHFTNSRTHTTNIVDPDASYNEYFGHQSAIQYAYTHSISGTK